MVYFLLNFEDFKKFCILHFYAFILMVSRLVSDSGAEGPFGTNSGPVLRRISA